MKIDVLCRRTSILQVWEDPGTVEFRGVFRAGSKVRPWEALLQIFAIFGCPWGSRRAPFSDKNAVFLRVQKIVDFWCLIWQDRRQGADPPES